MAKQNKLVIDVLKRMSEAGILANVLLVGSWCASFYKEYFSSPNYNPTLKTRDIDFLTKPRPRFPKNNDFENLLSPLGFEIEFFGKGFMKLESEDLLIEFIAPEVGPHKENAIELPELNFNAQPMRHMAMLWRNPIEIIAYGISIHLPHPSDFCFQKLIASSKRKRNQKAEKDRLTALEVFDALIEKGEVQSLHKALNNLSRNEKKIAISELRKSGRDNVLSL